MRPMGPGRHKHLWPRRMEFGCGARIWQYHCITLDHFSLWLTACNSRVLIAKLQISPPDPHVVHPGSPSSRAPDHPSSRAYIFSGFVTRPWPWLSVGQNLYMHRIPDFTDLQLEAPIDTDMNILGTDHSRKITSSVPRSTFPALTP